MILSRNTGYGSGFDVDSMTWESWNYHFELFLQFIPFHSSNIFLLYDNITKANKHFRYNNLNN